MEVWGTMQAARRRGDDGGQRQVVMNFIYTPKGHCLCKSSFIFFGRRRDILRGGLPPQRLTSLLTVGPLSRGLPYCDSSHILCAK